jgi:hypothetical protein
LVSVNDGLILYLNWRSNKSHLGNFDGTKYIDSRHGLILPQKQAEVIPENQYGWLSVALYETHGNPVRTSNFCKAVCLEYEQAGVFVE